jgi:hypothetical protein
MGEPRFKGRHTSFTSDVMDLYGNTAVVTAFSTTATLTAAFPEGIYDMWASQDCYIEQLATGTAASVSSTTGYLLLANNFVSIQLSSTEKIGVVRSSASGNLTLHKVEATV